MGTPFMRSITMTFWVHRSQIISGTSTRPQALHVVAQLRGVGGLAHQVELVVQVGVELGHHLARLEAPPSVDRRSIQPASVRISAGRRRSPPACAGAAPSRRPRGRPFSVAKCTCAIEALATGSASNWRTLSSTGRRRFSTAPRLAPPRKGGTRSCRRPVPRRSRAAAGRAASRAPDRTLTKIGPRRSRPWRRRTPRGCIEARPIVSTRTSAHPLAEAGRRQLVQAVAGHRDADEDEAADVPHRAGPAAVAAAQARGQRADAAHRLAQAGGDAGAELSPVRARGVADQARRSSSRSQRRLSNSQLTSVASCASPANLDARLAAQRPQEGSAGWRHRPRRAAQAIRARPRRTLEQPGRRDADGSGGMGQQRQPTLSVSSRHSAVAGGPPLGSRR